MLQSVKGDHVTARWLICVSSPPVTWSDRVGGGGGVFAGRRSGAAAAAGPVATVCDSGGAVAAVAASVAARVAEWKVVQLRRASSAAAVDV